MSIADVRRRAYGDAYDPNTINEKFITSRYDGLVTHPVSKYTKTVDYPHGPLCKPYPGTLWCK